MPRLVPVHWRRLERMFQHAGYGFLRQEGSHRVYTRPGSIRPVVIPACDEVPVAVIKSNLRTAGLSRDEYFRLIEIG